jgi:hypothetical protein
MFDVPQLFAAVLHRHARESGHPGVAHAVLELVTLDARFRGHDGFGSSR